MFCSKRKFYIFSIAICLFLTMYTVLGSIKVVADSSVDNTCNPDDLIAKLKELKVPLILTLFSSLQFNFPDEFKVADNVLTQQDRAQILSKQKELYEKLVYDEFKNYVEEPPFRDFHESIFFAGPFISKVINLLGNFGVIYEILYRLSEIDCFLRDLEQEKKIYCEQFIKIAQKITDDFAYIIRILKQMDEEQEKSSLFSHFCFKKQKLSSQDAWLLGQLTSVTECWQISFLEWKILINRLFLIFRELIQPFAKYPTKGECLKACILSGPVKQVLNSDIQPCALYPHSFQKFLIVQLKKILVESMLSKFTHFRADLFVRAYDWGMLHWNTLNVGECTFEQFYSGLISRV